MQEVLHLIDKLTDINKNVVLEIVKAAVTESKKRNFSQTVDVGVNVKGINFKQPQNRIDVSVQIPNLFKGKPKVVLFSKSKEIAAELKGVIDKVIVADDIPSIAKKDAKKVAREYGLFFADPSVMALVGKHLGQILAPRGKMPKPAPPSSAAIKGMIDQSIKTIRMTNKKGKFLPTLHYAIGKESMDAEKITDNFMLCYEKLLDSLPGKTQNIKSLYIKTTMGKPLFVYRK